MAEGLTIERRLVEAAYGWMGCSVIETVREWGVF